MRRKRPATRALDFGGADEETRTLDPRITSAVLYQLSYIGLRVSRSCTVYQTHARLWEQTWQLATRRFCQNQVATSRLVS